MLLELEQDSALKHTTIMNELTYPVHYDAIGQYIWDKDHKTIAGVRGWGWIQKLHNPEETQDKMGGIHSSGNK